MAVNGVYRHVDVTIVDLAEEIAGWGVRRSLGLVTSTLEEVATALESEDPLEGSHPRLREDISGFVSNLLAGKRAGAPRS